MELIHSLFDMSAITTTQENTAPPTPFKLKDSAIRISDQLFG